MFVVSVWTIVGPSWTFSLRASNHSWSLLSIQVLSSSTILLAGGDISLSSFKLELHSCIIAPFPEFFILLVLTGI
jgi:hypothetical protein